VWRFRNSPTSTAGAGRIPESPGHTGIFEEPVRFADLKFAQRAILTEANFKSGPPAQWGVNYPTLALQSFRPAQTLRKERGAKGIV
jgi:hypothetical protein